MLGNSTEKKMVFISSTTNEWPQNEHQGMNMSSAGTRAMDKQTQQQQITQESLKCPRCDSSNTKFCYYNNYSLSQPRHFCKACKRYWTRGGTLRNVPVGGGCRRNNKKIRRSISAIDLPPSSSSSPAAMSINPNTTHSQINPVFFGFPTNPNPNSNSEMGTLTYPSFNPRDSSAEAVLGFEPQMSGFGLGFSNHDGNYQNGTTNSLLSSYSLFGSSTNSPTIASLLGSNLNQQKFINNVNGGFQGLGSFEEMQMGGNASRKVKREEGQTYQNPNIQNHLEQTNPSDSSLYWNATNFGTWLDPTTIGSSVPSLI